MVDVEYVKATYFDNCASLAFCATTLYFLSAVFSIFFLLAFWIGSRGSQGNGEEVLLLDTLNLCKSAKHSVIAYVIVFSEYGKANASISSMALPLTATPTLVKRGNKIGIYLCKRTRLNSLT